MNTIEIPFNKFIGIERPHNQEQYLLELPSSPNYENHLGTVHASAQFALAEACSGEYLLKIFTKYTEKIIPIVRKSETKFKKPAEGKLFAAATLEHDNKEEIIEKLESKGRVVIPVKVTISNTKNEITMNAKIDWFIQKMES